MKAMGLLLLAHAIRLVSCDSTVAALYIKTLQKIGEKNMMNLKIGDIVKAKGYEIRLVVVGASDKGYDLFSVWPYNDRFIYWSVDADGHGDILSIVPDPEWDAMKVTNLQKKTGRDGT